VVATVVSLGVVAAAVVSGATGVGHSIDFMVTVEPSDSTTIVPFISVR